MPMGFILCADVIQNSGRKVHWLLTKRSFKCVTDPELNRDKSTKRQLDPNVKKVIYLNARP